MTVRACVSRRRVHEPIALLLAGLGAMLLASTCGPPVTEATTSVAIDGTTWRVLRADPDGMRGRADFEGADGMLFDAGESTDPSAVLFVMDGVALDLDIAWFAADGSFIGMRSMAACAAEPCPRYAAPASFRWAIEASPGAFDHLTTGSRLEPGPTQGP